MVDLYLPKIKMQFDHDYIEKYKKGISKEFLTKSIEQLKKEFKTDRLCWSLIMWTYKRIGLVVESEEELKLLAEKFHRIRYEENYKFPDIVLFKGGSILQSRVSARRHAGIMLDRTRFVHIGMECNGLQFTHLDRLPWSKLDKIAIRHNEIDMKKEKCD